MSAAFRGLTPRRRSPARVLGILLRVTVVVALLVGVWAAGVGALWLYASAQLRGVPVAALREDVLLLGASGARAPADATTLLVLLVEPLDPTVRRPSPLAAPPIILQVDPTRTEPSVLVLPPTLAVLVPGRGVMELAAVQRELGADRLAQAIIDYTEVRLDHVVVLSTDVLPGLIRILGPLEVCGADGCSEPTPDEVRAWQRDDDPVQVLRRSADVLRAVAAVVDRRAIVRSPLRYREVVDLLGAQVVADADLGLTRLLGLAPGFTAARRLEVESLPMVQNPATGELVVLEESAMLRFQRLREGLSLAGIDPARDVARLRSVVRIAVLNGAGVPGLAALVEAELLTAGFLVVGTGNDTRFDRVETVVKYRAGDAEAEPVAFLLVEELEGARLEPTDGPLVHEGEAVSIVVVLGTDRVSGGG